MKLGEWKQKWKPIPKVIKATVEPDGLSIRYHYQLTVLDRFSYRQGIEAEAIFPRRIEERFDLFGLFDPDAILRGFAHDLDRFWGDMPNRDFAKNIGMEPNDPNLAKEYIAMMRYIKVLEDGLGHDCADELAGVEEAR